MSAYHYQALKKSGSSCRGVIEAESEKHARQLLRADARRQLPARCGGVTRVAPREAGLPGRPACDDLGDGGHDAHGRQDEPRPPVERVVDSD